MGFNTAGIVLEPYWQQKIASGFQRLIAEQMRPCVLFKPTLTLDVKCWCALYGENIQDGVAGFGDTPEAAMENFDLNWKNMKFTGAKG